MGFFNNNNNNDNDNSNNELNVFNKYNNVNKNVRYILNKNKTNKRNNHKRNSTKKDKKRVQWKNYNNLYYNINAEYPEEYKEARKSIKKRGVPNNSNLTSEELKIVKKVLKKNTKYTAHQAKLLRKAMIDFLKEKKKKYDLQHLEEFEKDFLEFEAMRNEFR